MQDPDAQSTTPSPAESQAESQAESRAESRRKPAESEIGDTKGPSIGNDD